MISIGEILLESPKISSNDHFAVMPDVPVKVDEEAAVS